MDYAARAELARELLPHLPDEAAERAARRTATFGGCSRSRAGDPHDGDDPGGASEQADQHPGGVLGGG
jgi:hypothetical protein